MGLAAYIARCEKFCRCRAAGASTPAVPLRQNLCRLVVFADLGQSYNSSSTLDHMADSLDSDGLTGAAAHLVYVPLHGTLSSQGSAAGA